MNETAKAGIAFVGVFVLVVAVAGVLGIAMSEDPAPPETPEYTEVNNPQYDADRVMSNETPGQANVQMSSGATDKTVVVHAGGTVAERDLAPLVNALAENNHNVKVIAEQPSFFGPGPIAFQDGAVSQIGPPPGGGDEPMIDGELEDAHGFVSIGVGSYVEEDLEALGDFVEDNGRVVMAVNPSQEFSFGGGLADAYAEIGAFTEPGYVYNLEENDLNYQRIFVEPSDGIPLLTDGVDRAVFDSATPVQSSNIAEQLVPIEGSQLSVTRAETEKPVLVRDGDVALIGDTDFMIPENTQRADNDVLVGNLADFLVSGDRVLESEQSEEDGNGESETVTVEVGPEGEPVFAPEVTEIEPGTTVEFVWKSDGHNIVPVNQDPTDLEWDGVNETQDEGFIHQYTFQEEGFHEYVSEPFEDEGMFGVIVVGNPEE